METKGKGWKTAGYWEKREVEDPNSNYSEEGLTGSGLDQRQMERNTLISHVRSYVTEGSEGRWIWE